jgi:methylglyoxal synthase
MLDIIKVNNMQIDYTNSLDSGPLVLGQVYDTSLAQVDGFMAEESIAFGAFVQYGSTVAASNGTTAPLIKKLTTTGKFIGIAVRDMNQPVGGTLATAAQVAAGTVDAMTTITTALESYPIGAGVSVMRLGRVSIMIPKFASDGTTATVMTNAALGATVLWNGSTGAMTFSALPISPEVLATAINIGTLVTMPVAGQLAVVQINELV